MATYVLTIAGSAKTLHEASLQISESANGRNTFAGAIDSLDGTYRPAIGAEVILTEDGTRIFGGTIDAPAEAGFGGIAADNAITTHISAVDFNALADRRYVSTTIAAGTLKAALQALDDYLTAYGVTLDVAQVNGPNLDALSYSYTKLSDIFNELARLTGYVWEIDYTKTLRMFDPSVTAAPFNILNADGNVIGDITVEPDRADYANRIIVRFTAGALSAYIFYRAVGANLSNGNTATVGGKTYTFQTVLTNVDGNVLIGATTDDTLENFRAAINLDAGAGSTYAVATTINSQVSAYLLRTGMLRVGAKTAGASGNSIACTTTAAVADWTGEGDVPHATLQLGADAALTNTVEADDAAEQAANGIWERILDAPDITTAAAAQSLADAELTRAIVSAKVVKYVTEQTGIHPGQTQTITVTNRNLSGTFTVTAVEISNVAGTVVRRAVTAAGGTAVPLDWRDVYRKWAGGGSSSSPTTTAVPGGAVATTSLTGVLQAAQFPALTGDVTTVAGALATTVTGTLGAIRALAVTDGNIIVGNGATWVAESGATARTSLGVAIGTDVQAYSARLAEIAALAVTDSNIIVGNGSAWVAESGATARTSLGLGLGDSPQFTTLTLTGNLIANTGYVHIGNTYGFLAREYVTHGELVGLNAALDTYNDFEIRAGTTGTGLTVSTTLNFGLSTQSFPSTGTYVLVFGDGAAPSGMGANTAGYYADDVSGTVHPFAISEAGVTMQLTGAANNTLAVAVQDLIVQLGKNTKYNAISTAGWGLPAIYGSGRSTAQSAAVASVATYTVGAADGSFIVSANVNVTTSTLHSFSVQVDYTDETNTAQTLTLSLSQLSGALVTTITNGTGAGPYEGVPVRIRAKTATAITIKTTGTFTSVTYNVEGDIVQVAG